MLSKSEDLGTGDQDILIALGANLPGAGGQSPIETCRAAIAALGALPGLRLVGVSRWYETAPVPPSGQPPYVNGVAHLRGRIAPEALLAALQAIEARAGRTRGAANAARTLDLDIVAMGDLVRPAPDPVLPHPRAHLRAFVLVPLLDVMPDWVHPLLGQTARALLGDLPPQRICAL
jgi:2-amino-4-hydroxy-6-hydroxymethyldihydropteridine diphosphokinase